MTCLHRFWLRAISIASESAQRRFITSFGHFVYGIVDEVSDRTRGHVRGIEDYFKLRRHTAATYAAFFPIELGLDIPDDVMAHPALATLISLTADTIMLTNVCIPYLLPDVRTALTYKIRTYARMTLSKLPDLNKVGIISSLSS